MKITPDKVALFIPDEVRDGKSDAKRALFERIGEHVRRAGGKVVRGDAFNLTMLPDEIWPIVGCTPYLRPIIDTWTARGRPWIYWDRGYFRRIYATHLPRGDAGGFYRWHMNSFQMPEVFEAPDDRWKAANIQPLPWRGDVPQGHILIAGPTDNYSAFHRTERWTDAVVDSLGQVTKRRLVMRGKESKRTLQEDLAGAHAVVAHASNAAVEAAILGCPVFVDRSSAAALLGNVFDWTHPKRRENGLEKIEAPHLADREPWLRALAYSQFSEKELIDGTLWKLLR